MNRRTCACGATIVCADLDGWTVWLDQHPDGWITIDNHGQAEIGAGTWRRHSCTHDPRPLDLDGPPAVNAPNSERAGHAAARNLAAIHAVLADGRELTAIQQRAAELRAAHPELSQRQIARRAGLSRNAFTSALRHIQAHADRITRTAA